MQAHAEKTHNIGGHYHENETEEAAGAGFGAGDGAGAAGGGGALRAKRKRDGGLNDGTRVPEKLTKRGAWCRITPTSQEATGETRRKCAVHKKAVGPLFFQLSLAFIPPGPGRKEGGAHGKKALEEDREIRDRIPREHLACVAVSPKSELTARLAPERSTDSV